MATSANNDLESYGAKQYEPVPQNEDGVDENESLLAGRVGIDRPARTTTASTNFKNVVKLAAAFGCGVLVSGACFVAFPGLCGKSTSPPVVYDLNRPGTHVYVSLSWW